MISNIAYCISLQALTTTKRGTCCPSTLKKFLYDRSLYHKVMLATFLMDNSCIWVHALGCYNSIGRYIRITAKHYVGLSSPLYLARPMQYCFASWIKSSGTFSIVISVDEIFVLDAHIAYIVLK